MAYSTTNTDTLKRQIFDFHLSHHNQHMPLHR